MITTNNLKKMLVGTLLSGGVALAGFGLTTGTAYASPENPGPFDRLPGLRRHLGPVQEVRCAACPVHWTPRPSTRPPRSDVAVRGRRLELRHRSSPSDPDVAGGGLNACGRLAVRIARADAGHRIDRTIRRCDESVDTALHRPRRATPNGSRGAAPIGAGAPFVVVHLSFPQRDATERALWLARQEANLVASGISAAQAESAIAMIGREVRALTPDEDQSILQEAGFIDVTEFFSALTFRGWVGYA